MADTLAGISVYDIELPLGLEMTGYIGREHGALGVHDPLHIKAIAIKSESKMLLLISCDLIGFKQSDIEEMSAHIMECTGIPIDNIIICCTHTHSAPATIQLYGCGEIDMKWLTKTKQLVVACAEESVRKLSPAILQLYYGECDVAANRVLSQMWGGKDTENWETRDWDEENCGNYPNVSELYKEGINASNYVDKEILVLGVLDKKGDTIALLINYACHPVTLEYTNYLYSSDFPYGIEKRIWEHLPNIAVFYLNGCCGDINPCERGGFETAEDLGGKIGQSVLDILQKPGVSIERNLDIKRAIFSVPLAVHIDEKLLLRRLEVYERGIIREGSSDNKIAGRVYRAYTQWAEKMLSDIHNKCLPLEVKVDVRVVRLDDFTIVTVPFELFHEIGLSIKEYFGKGRTMVITYANGENGYFISRKLYPYAKYERCEAFKFTP
jgi:neutral ceramidase